MSKEIRLKQLASKFNSILVKMQAEGISIDWTHPIEGKPVVTMALHPFIICPECDNWTAAKECGSVFCRERLDVAIAFAESVG